MPRIAKPMRMHIVNIDNRTVSYPGDPTIRKIPYRPDGNYEGLNIGDLPRSGDYSNGETIFLRFLGELSNGNWYSIDRKGFAFYTGEEIWKGKLSVNEFYSGNIIRILSTTYTDIGNGIELENIKYYDKNMKEKI